MKQETNNIEKLEASILITNLFLSIIFVVVAIVVTCKCWNGFVPFFCSLGALLAFAVLSGISGCSAYLLLMINDHSEFPFFLHGFEVIVTAGCAIPFWYWSAVHGCFWSIVFPCFGIVLPLICTTIAFFFCRSLLGEDMEKRIVELVEQEKLWGQYRLDFDKRLAFKKKITDKQQFLNLKYGDAGCMRLIPSSLFYWSEELLNAEEKFSPQASFAKLVTQFFYHGKLVDTNIVVREPGPVEVTFGDNEQKFADWDEFETALSKMMFPEQKVHEDCQIIACPNCKAKLCLPADLVVGQPVVCPECDSKFTITESHKARNGESC